MVAIWRIYFHGPQLNIAPHLERQRDVCSYLRGQADAFPVPHADALNGVEGVHFPGSGRVRAPHWQGGTFQ